MADTNNTGNEQRPTTGTEVPISDSHMLPRIAITFWNRYFGDAFRQIETESLVYRQSEAGHRFDWKTVMVLVTAAACLTAQKYASHPVRVKGTVGFVVRTVAGDDHAAAALRTLDRWATNQSDTLTWWAANSVVTLAIIPILVLKLGFRESLSDYGTKVHGIHKSWPVYLLFVAVMVPIVAVMSADEGFQRTYPFYRVGSSDQIGPEFLRWELCYAMQFVALEFFFRGFIVHGTKHRFGIYSTFVMMIPYCMIHFQKPLPESCGAIAAGIALGFVSLSTRSVWLGAALHITVAWGMDFATLTRRGLLHFN